MGETGPVTIIDIPSWKLYFFTKLPRPIKQGRLAPSDNILNGKVSIWNGNITRLKLDAIVNATNAQLKGNPKGSVGSAIHNEAGPRLLAYLEQIGGCETGKAIITPGFNLFANYVIHTTSPTNSDEESLAQCYRSCLNILVEMGLRTIAFPCIATGACGYPQAEAAHIAIRETWKFLSVNHHKVDRIVFCTYLPEDTFTYDALMQLYFPVENLI
ncbi:unnamed protein product [Allacma fusca]|uniref:Macro domain-containing protein n=1 Tax=Allacma fusca TaxID=39272 RepID=A0A8J2JG40_9HEXA|nr:unnamed protein product [Allacma fusca]